MSLLPDLPRRSLQARVSADEVARVEAEVALALATIEDLDQLDEWRARAAALEKYLRGKDLQLPMRGAQRRVEARIGQLLGEPEKGGRGKRSEHDPRLRDYLPEFRLLGRALSGECPVSDTEWRKSRRSLVALVRDRLGIKPELPSIGDAEYRCIVADPPWQQDTGGTFGTESVIEGGHDALSYRTMPVEAIKSLAIGERRMEAVAAKDAHLYLWTTNRYIETAYGVARAWGFKPSVLLVWAKEPRGVGLGDAFRLTTEFVLYARRGKLRERNIVPTTWFSWPRGQHSEKPSAFYEMVETMSPGPRLDVFGRRSRADWIVWGDEVGA